MYRLAWRNKFTNKTDYGIALFDKEQAEQIAALFTNEKNSTCIYWTELAPKNTLDKNNQSSSG